MHSDDAPSWIREAPGRRRWERDGGGENRGCRAHPSIVDVASRKLTATIALAAGAEPGRVDVGTGGAFQVPPLVGVSWRAPFLHDGCAATLADRFGSCATSAHGKTQALGTGDVADLVAYLESL